MLPALLLVQTIFNATAAVVPLTEREISLMLRSGYSNEAVLNLLPTRHFAGNLDSDGEQQLVRAGANPSLITALRSGVYAASPEEIATAQEKLAALEKPSAPVSPPSNSLKTPHPKPTTVSPPAATPSPDAIYRLLENDLVSLQRGEVKPFDGKAIAEKKFYLLFYSAGTSAFARKLTPLLVEYYNRIAPLYPEFETVFFSKDRSLFGMETYMVQSNMPWPAVVFDKAATTIPVQATAADLPLLILISGTGQVLYRSPGETNADFGKVTADLEKILATRSVAPPPVRR